MTTYRSPLSSEQIACLAELVDAGQGVAAELSCVDVGAVMGLVIRRRERRRVAALLAQAELADDGAARDRLAARERDRRKRLSLGLAALAPPDEIVVDILCSPEWQIVVTLLSAMVSLPMAVASGREPVWSQVPLGAMAGYAARPQAQARTLVQYLRQKVMGDPVCARGMVVGRSLPATECHPHASRLRPPLRAWANGLGRLEAVQWLDFERALRHFDAIGGAGLRTMALYGRTMDRLGLPVDGLHAGIPLELPQGAAPLTEGEALAVGLEPEFRPMVTLENGAAKIQRLEPSRNGRY